MKLDLIYILEDNTDILKIYEREFTAQGYEVKTQSLDEQVSEEIGVSTEDKDTDLGQ
jgi:hypothetical protein